MKSKVSVVRCKNYDDEKVELAVRNSVELLGGLKGIIKEGDKVLLKVNLLAPTEPKKGVTTHPSVVRAIIKLVKEAGGMPLVSDAPGFLFVASKNKALINSGIMKVADEEGVEAIQFEAVENAFIKTGIEDGMWLKSAYAARLALESDVVLSIPKLKTHTLTYLTGAVKNMFGVVAPRTRRQAHNLAKYEKFCGSVVDIYSIKRPHLAIMDAVIGMEGGGPRHGDVKYTGLILASCDCVSLDAVASEIIGFKAGEIFTTKLAHERGLGVGDLDSIDILGENIEDVFVEYAKPNVRKNIPSFAMTLFDKFLKIEPFCDQEKCNKCDICRKSCPAEVISLNPYPEINREHCIECFCCNEMCPEGAMIVKKNWLARRMTG